MERQFFSGNTLEQALLSAARHFGLDPDQIAYRQREKKHGFLNIRRKVVIEVDPKNPERGQQEASAAVEETGPELHSSGTAGSLETSQVAEDKHVEEPSEASESTDAEAADAVTASDDAAADDSAADDSAADDSAADDRAAMSDHVAVDDGDRADEGNRADDETVEDDVAAMEKALDKILDLMDIDLDMSVELGDDGFEVELLGSDEDLPLDERGRVLDAVEHLLPRMYRGMTGHGTQCQVDFKGYRAAHKKALRDLAMRAARAVRDSQQERRLEPMNPADRRQVHMALADDSAVETESEGHGFLKRVRILPIG